MSLFSNKIKVTDFQLSDTIPVYSNSSWTGSVESRLLNIQYFTIQFTLNFNQKDAGEYKAFQAQYSTGAPFPMSLGFYSKYYGAETNAINAEVGANIGTYLIQCHTKLEVGTLIQFQNHSKIYKVMVNDQDNGILSIFPLLRADVQVGETIKYSNIEGQFILDNSNDYALSVANQMSVQLTATEYLP